MTRSTKVAANDFALPADPPDISSIAAGMDWIGDGDHDYGNGREYSWWTTQKVVTLFTLPGRFVPVYGYERSVRYPEGHRNCMFAYRGVRSLPRLPISSPDEFAPAPDTNLLYKYLHYFNGICASHTSATDMGTDWRNHDPEVEPFVEIYQGDRNNYERPDSPRSAVTEAKLKQSTPEKESIGKTSYYYVRGEQEPDLDGATAGELVWASPMWITVQSE